MRTLLALLVLLPLGAAEVLKGEAYRAVTLEPKQRKQFRVPGLERVTGASGKCIEEGMDVEEPETFWLEATCGGVRTALVWLTDGTRISVMACAEEERTPAQLKLRQALQAEVKRWRTVTACVREGRVELWGWVKTAEEKKKLTALETRYGLDLVRDRVEIIGEE